MSTGSVKTKTPTEVRAAGVRFERRHIVVEFRDGREMHVPLAHYPTLQKSTPSARDRWQMIGGGRAFHWPALDLDLSVEGLMRGLREAIPSPPKLPARRRA